MQWTGLNELRDRYLSFFESKGHLRLDSFPLVPKNDPSLLLINSGMAPMKKWFLAQEEPPRHRVTTCQKCIRTRDIERVGITARHGTYFEMLGNFSFQDYFKDEVIPWAWEFLTSEEWMAIPKDRLYISVYEKDDEAYEIWTQKVGIAPDHMVRLGKEDNFWEHGSGPCGPCSEIHFDRGPQYGCGKPTCGVGCDCDRYMEVWNLVFSQFDYGRQGPLRAPAPPQHRHRHGSGASGLRDAGRGQTCLRWTLCRACCTMWSASPTRPTVPTTRTISPSASSPTTSAAAPSWCRTASCPPTKAAAMCCAVCCAVLPAMAGGWASSAPSW